MHELENYQENTFEGIKHVDESGAEFWYAHELAKALEYEDYRNFENAMYKAMDACQNSGAEPKYHFGEITEMIKIGKGAMRPIDGHRLTRYACYLIVQNADPSKEVIAIGQTYFAIQTQKQEMIERFEHLSEDDKRLKLRVDMAEHNVQLVEAAKNAGVETNLDYAIFQNEGYKGLYGGLGAKEIHNIKNLKKSQKILDHMGSTELAANLFRATQTEEKLRRENVQGKQNANQTHYIVGETVRKTIHELGGTMPENLPTPEKSIQQIERENKKALKLNEKHQLLIEDDNNSEKG